NRVDQEPSYRRNIGMVFQNYAIFPHMSVADNVAYGLRARKLPEREVQERVAEALTQVEMADYGARRRDQLSGGQQQRVALARALATRPAVLLMDEPLSNLDARLRQSMRAEIRRLQKQVGITTIYVTHDQEEALAISDRIAVMEAGKILQVGSPVEIYRRPAHKAVAAFVGTCSFLAAEVGPHDAVTAGGKRFERAFKSSPSGVVTLGLRPEACKPLPVGWEPPGEVALNGVVEEETYLGAGAHVKVRLTTGESLVALSTQLPGSFPPGAKLVVAFRPEDTFAFDPATGGAVR
ncbi:MAG TPA: ABC transporter ATP-binding protein, partial [Symbiobacteriaceae bacterium]|nr:ABC transporter ATP-binding protein [Symbiobacteriaceae bacterium]